MRRRRGILAHAQHCHLASGVCLLVAHSACSLVCSLALIGMSGEPASGEDLAEDPQEYHIKAVSLYAFSRYVTWPDEAFDSSKDSFVIGILGGNPFGDVLERIARGKTVDGRTLEIRRLTAIEDAAACQMVFVTRRIGVAMQEELIAQVGRRPVLLVGESPGFAERGGIINFYQSGDNIRFELNRDKSIESQLSLDAKLLSLGTKASSEQ